MNATAKKEKLGFQTEAKQLLHLVIHSLYGDKEIFLRELISNASDAADKLRFASATDPFIFADDPDLKVWVTFDKEARTLTVRDNGIGMTREEVIQYLGTIAKSGTRELLNSLTGDKSKDSNLIGQFGVGFYSAFMVADTVVVTTRKAGHPVHEAVRWTSNGEGEYELESVEKSSRGTEIVLHLKKDEDELLNAWRLEHIIRKYSDHLTLPVVMMKQESAESDAKEADAGEKADTPPVEKVINRATALWTLPKSQITDDQYKELYKHISHDFEDPLIWSHNKVEGKLEYITLLYIPARAPFDLWQSGKTRGLKLYVRRVFIMDDSEQFLPHYLRFVRGIIDSTDLPLNISREILQSNRMVDTIRAAVIKRILGMLEELSIENAEKYQKFWKAFGQVLKEGPAEDFANREQIAKLLRFSTTHTDREAQETSLEDYMKRMQSEQTKIYYITADTFNAAKNSPHLEIFREKGIEVLLLSDRVDEWLVSHLTEFQGKSFQSVARGNLDDNLLKPSDSQISEEMHKQVEGDFEATIQKVKSVLKDAVKDVRLSRRLTNSPACIVVDEQDLSTQMERLLKAAGQKVPDHKPILELNPEHTLVQRLKQELDGVHFEDWAHILLDQAILAEGGQLNNPAAFVKRFNALLINL